MEAGSLITLADPDVKKCPFAAHDRVRLLSPAYRDPVTGFYLVTRFDDVRRLALDTKRLSNSTGQLLTREGPNMVAVNKRYADRGYLPMDTLATADPPVHRLYRSLVEKAFTPKRVAAMHDYLHGIVTDLIDEFVDKGEVEFVREFAIPLPTTVIADQLGIPREDLPLFKKWSDATIELIDPLLDAERELVLTDLIIEMQKYVVAEAARLRRNPRDSLFSDLVQAQVDGRSLDNREICSIVQQLLVAGNETTTSALASAMILMIEQPSRAERMFTEPMLIAPFVEEVLRLRAPAQGILRRALEEIEVGEVVIPKGALVYLVVGAANHDASQFDDPHEVDFSRSNSKNHLTFGAGIHFCIGAQLARAELNIAVDEIVRRLGNCKFVNGGNSVDFITAYTYGPSKVEFAFDRR